VVAQKPHIEEPVEEPEPADDIELPPPMPIQDHVLYGTQETSPDDVTSKLVRLPHVSLSAL